MKTNNTKTDTPPTGENTADDYADIIDLPRPVPKTHRPMPLLARAGQFAAFSALNGHKAALDEAADEWQDSVVCALPGDEEENGETSTAGQATAATYASCSRDDTRLRTHCFINKNK